MGATNVSEVLPPTGVVAVALAEIVIVDPFTIFVIVVVVPGMPVPVTVMPTARLLVPGRFVIVFVLIVVVPPMVKFTLFVYVRLGTSRPVNLLRKVILNGPPGFWASTNTLETGFNGSVLSTARESDSKSTAAAPPWERLRP